MSSWYSVCLFFASPILLWPLCRKSWCLIFTFTKFFFIFVDYVFHHTHSLLIIVLSISSSFVSYDFRCKNFRLIQAISLRSNTSLPESSTAPSVLLHQGMHFVYSACLIYRQLRISEWTYCSYLLHDFCRLIIALLAAFFTDNMNLTTADQRR